MQHENAWSPYRVRVILNNGGTTDTIQDIVDCYTILGEFVIAVFRNANRAKSYQGLNLSEGVAQLVLWSVDYSAASLAPLLFPGLPAFFSTGARNFPV